MPTSPIDTLLLPPERHAPNRLGPVELRQLLAKGGTADVYLGFHPGLNRLVAVKVVHAHLAETPEVLDRFRQEAHAAAGLRHPNIVQVHDFAAIDGRPSLVMEYLPGPTLAQHLTELAMRGETLSPRAALEIALGIADALEYAHRNGVVHRDVKPGNVALRISPDEPRAALPASKQIEPVLMDFGIARLAHGALVTATGAFLGTPAYMSPEQIRGEPVDGRTDIYSLGIVLYQMLTGRLPHDPELETVTALLHAHLHSPFPPLPAEVAGLQSIVDKCLSADRDRRYATVADLARDLRRILAAEAGTTQATASMLRTTSGRQIVRDPIRLPSSFRRKAALALLACGLVACGAGIWAVGTGRGASLWGLRDGLSGVAPISAGEAKRLIAEPSATGHLLPEPTTGAPSVEASAAPAGQSSTPSATPSSPASTPVPPTQRPTTPPTTAPVPTDPPLLPPLPLPLPTSLLP